MEPKMEPKFDIARAVEVREQEKHELSRRIYTILFDWKKQPTIFYDDPKEELAASTAYETDKENMDEATREKYEKHLRNKLRNRWLSNFYDAMEQVIQGGFLKDTPKEAWKDVLYIEDEFAKLRNRKEGDEYICGIDCIQLKDEKNDTDTTRDPHEKGVTRSYLELISPYLKRLSGDSYTQYAELLVEEMRCESIVQAFPELKGKSYGDMEEAYQQELNKLVIPGTRINDNTRYVDGTNEFMGADWLLLHVAHGLNPELTTVDPLSFKHALAVKLGITIQETQRV